MVEKSETDKTEKAIEKMVREIASKAKAIVEKINQRTEKLEELERVSEELEKIEIDILNSCTDEIVKFLPESAVAVVNELRDKYSSSAKKYKRKKIVFLGQEYSNMQYFMKKFGITGGVEGIKVWAEKTGYDCLVDADKIVIVPRAGKQ